MKPSLRMALVPESHVLPRFCAFGLLPLLISATAIAQVPDAATNVTANPARRGAGGFGFGGPAPLPAGVKAERNIPYVENGHRNQVLDLFLPEQPSDKPLPLMIWIHGGAWRNGSSRQACPFCIWATCSSGLRYATCSRWSRWGRWRACSFWRFAKVARGLGDNG